MSDPNHGPSFGVAFRTLGCKVNRVESDEIAAALLGVGVSITSEDAADVVVVNTCTVTGEADTKARKAVRQALKASSRPLVVVTGCLAALDAATLEALDDRVVVCADKEQVAARVAEALRLRAPEPHSGVVAAGEGFRTRAMLKIEDGCDHGCTYCIIPAARGLPRSVGRDEVLERARGLVRAGVNEIVVTGINIGRYCDPESGIGLPGLLGELLECGIPRLRLSSIEPLDLSDDLLEVLSSSRSACPHLHVPLQSGSDRVLAAMGRGYDIATFAERIDAARRSIPGLAVSTDVIAGFPTETDEDFALTLAACEELEFARMHVFRYSERPGTVAASMEPVRPEVRAQRAHILRERGSELADRYAAARFGQTATVLVEELGAGTCEGMTEDYLRARFGNSSAVEGGLVEVVLGRLEDGVMRAMPSGPQGG